MPELQEISIAPEPTIYFALKFVPSETWFALAEFIDNSINSYNNHEKELKLIEGKNFKLSISIIINLLEDTITIKDNASGIDAANFQRAFKAGDKPLNRDGLSEFGMGMKYAACWFADEWTVISTALGEDIERTVTFNIDDIVRDGKTTLSIIPDEATKNDHYTVIKLKGIKGKFTNKDSLETLKVNLKRIFRYFLIDDKIKLSVNENPITFTDFDVLKAPEYIKVSDGGEIQRRPKNETIITWEKKLHFVIDGHEINGFAALREGGKTSENEGLVIIRRGRLISSLGNEDKPEKIFRKPNSAISQRLTCVLYVNSGFEVSFTKQIQRNETYNKLIDKLYVELQNEPMDLLKQADNASYRDIKKNKVESKNLSSKNSEIKEDVGLFSNSYLPTPNQKTNTTNEKKAEKNVTQVTPISTPNVLVEKTNERREIIVHILGIAWKFIVEYSLSSFTCIELAPDLIQEKNDVLSQKYLGLRISTTHPYIKKYVVTNDQKETFERFLIALIIAEIKTQETFANASMLRQYVNDYLKNVVNAQIVRI